MTTVQHLKKQNSKLEKKFNQPQAKNESKVANNNRQNNKRQETYKSVPAWKKVPPTNGKGTMKKDGKTMFWCPAHKMWVDHMPKDCRFKKFLERKVKNNKAKQNKKNNNNDANAVNDQVEPNAENLELELDQNLTSIIEEEQGLDYEI